MKVIPLTKQLAEELSDELLSFEKFVNNVGGPNWTKENLMQDLPRKWELSFLLMNDKSILGYVIASERNGCYHIHRPFLLPEYRYNLTFSLIKSIFKRAKEIGFNEASWKSGTRIVGFEASRKMSHREEYVGNWDNSDFYYFYRKI